MEATAAKSELPDPAKKRVMAETIEAANLEKVRGLEDDRLQEFLIEELGSELEEEEDKGKRNGKPKGKGKYKQRVVKVLPGSSRASGSKRKAVDKDDEAPKQSGKRARA